MAKIQNKDTHTLCPVNPNGVLPLPSGQKVKVNGQPFTVKGSTAYMAWFQERSFHIEGASRSTPKEIEFELAE